MKELNYYQVLGVVPDADPVVIKAAYQALVSKYHPDRNSEAEEKFRWVNLAFSVLSDNAKRKEYDVSLFLVSHEVAEYDAESSGHVRFIDVDNDWAVAVRFYPEIESLSNNLEAISWRLSYSYKLKILENKKFLDGFKIYKKMKKSYLSRYFGKDQYIHDYAEQIILSGQHEAAVCLNEIISVIGSAASFFSIRKELENKFPRLPEILEARLLYHELGECSFLPAKKMIEFIGGKVKTSFFGGQIKVTLGDRVINFNENEEFCAFAKEEYKRNF